MGGALPVARLAVATPAEPPRRPGPDRASNSVPAGPGRPAVGHDPRFRRWLRVIAARASPGRAVWKQLARRPNMSLAVARQFLCYWQPYKCISRDRNVNFHMEQTHETHAPGSQSTALDNSHYEGSPIGPAHAARAGRPPRQRPLHGSPETTSWPLHGHRHAREHFMARQRPLHGHFMATATPETTSWLRVKTISRTGRSPSPTGCPAQVDSEYPPGYTGPALRLEHGDFSAHGHVPTTSPTCLDPEAPPPPPG